MKKTIAHACEALAILSNDERLTELPSAIWHLKQSVDILRTHIASNPLVPLREGTLIQEGDVFDTGYKYKPTGLAGTPYNPIKHYKHFRRLLDFTNTTSPAS